MSLYLNASCGPMHILIDVACILEVTDVAKQESLPATKSSLHGHFAWRDMVIPVINLPLYFGLNDVKVKRHIVVDSGSKDMALKFLVFGVEEGESLLTLSSDEMIDINQYNQELAPAFEGVYSQANSSQCLLVLRFPALWAINSIINTSLIEVTAA